MAISVTLAVQLFKRSPVEMSRDEFIATFGGVYEHSPWVAETVWEQGVDRQYDVVDNLANTMREVVDAASDERGLALIRAHPDLAGKAAVRGELTEESTGEQASAAIDQCSPEEFERFQSNNEAYKQKFGFPFVMAVRGSHRTQILQAFDARLQNTYEQEFDRALEEIHKIARLRLHAMAAEDEAKK